MNNKGIKRILYIGYAEFFLSISFWIAAGINAFKGISIWIYAVMFGLLVCSVVIILNAVLYDRLYMKNIRNNFQDLENLNGKLRGQRHEYLNEMQVVYGLLELQEYDEAVKYLRPIYADIAKVGKALKTSKPAVNALLQSKMEYSEKKNVELYVEVSSDLSGIPMEQWDLCKILGNLIDNSITAVSVNEGKKEVHIQISEQPLEYVLCVYNNGPVIPDNKKDVIFKKGYSSKKENGHGLGLWIVKDIVNESNGKIILTSSEDRTEFEIRIPKEK